MNWWPRNPILGFILGASIGLAIFFGLAAIAQAKPPTHGISTAVISINGKTSEIPSPPSTPCNLGHRMNVEIVDGWMYECECVVLSRGFHCSWYLIGQVESVAARKYRKQHRRLIPIIYIHPKVVG